MQPAARLASIDCFRGCAVMLMVMSSHLFTVDALPVWLRHAPDGKVTFPDLVAPWFVFAIALTFGASFRRRLVRAGPLATMGHFVRRATVLFVIGAAMALIQTSVGRNEGGVYWSVLQAIAVAIVLTLPTLLLPPLARATTGLVLLAAYQILLDRYWLSFTLAAPHGGLPGSLGWSCLLILSTVYADLYLDPKTRETAYPLAGAGMTALGLALSPLVPFSKLRVSASYVLFSLGVAVLVFWFFHLMVQRAGWRLAGFATWGKNPLVIYLLHYVFIGLLVLPPLPWWHAQAPYWLISLQAVFLVSVLTLIANYMERRKWLLSV